MQQINLIYRDPRELNPYANNPRVNEPALPKLQADIEEFGFVSPVLVAGNEIVDGHARHKVALEMELDAIPTVDVSHLTPEQIRALRIVMNKSAEWAQWDEEKLLEELAAIEMDMSRFGIDMGEAEEIAAKAAAEEKAFNYEEQFGVIVMCADEAAQEKTYNALKAQGYDCKVVAV